MSDKKGRDYIQEAADAVKGVAGEPAGKVVKVVKENPTLAGAGAGFLVGGPLGAVAGALGATPEGRQKAKDVANTGLGAAKSFLGGLSKAFDEGGQENKPADEAPKATGEDTPKDPSP